MPERESHERTVAEPTRRRRTAEPDESRPRRRTVKAESEESRPRRRTVKTESEESRPRRRTVRAESEESSPRRRTAKAESAAEDARAAPRPRRKAAGTIGAGRAAAVAARCVQELTGKPPESVISLEHASDGWRIGIEALESRRIPDSTDILAVYLVILDQEGELVSYRRERRYHRGRSEEEQ